MNKSEFNDVIYRCFNLSNPYLGAPGGGGGGEATFHTFS